MKTTLTLIALIAVDFVLTWGAVHGALEMFQAAGLYDWEPTMGPTALIAVGVKLVRAVL